ncbi:MAG: SpoIID/LytB domain-containing protein [Desulfocucumaceae bacterium]
MRRIIAFKPLQTAFLLLFILLVTIVPCRAESVSVIPRTVRVGIAQAVKSQEFYIRGSYRVVDRQDGKLLSSLSPGERWEVRAGVGGMELYRNGQQVAAAGSTIGIQQAGGLMAVLGENGSVRSIGDSDSLSVIISDGSVSSLKMEKGKISIVGSTGVSSFQGGQDTNLVSVLVSGRAQSYRGDMEFRLQEGGITVINEVSLEEYLYGVLPREMPSSWLLEAQKAQAVAARSFAVAQLGTYNSYGFDLLATQSSQMYGGFDAENSISTRAVNETCGQAVLYSGKPVSAFFHSSSGGYIENAQDVWREQLDYIKAKPDPYDKNEKQYNWVVSYTVQELVNQLNSKKALFNKVDSSERLFSEISQIDVLEKTSSSVRVKRIRVTGVGNDGRPMVAEISNADAVRMALGLKSSLFDMKKGTDTQGKLLSLTITGSGYGHGLGMSQYGALGMAGQGYNYQDILKYYYCNCDIGPISGAE